MICKIIVNMPKYRLICPNCGASVVTLVPEAVMWELCPGCLKHGWDAMDVQMAEPVDGQVSDGYSSKPSNNIMTN